MKYLKVKIEELIAMPGRMSNIDYLHKKLDPEEKEERKNNRDRIRQEKMDKHAQKIEEKKKFNIEIKDRVNKYKEPISYTELKETFEGFNGGKEHPQVLVRWVYNLWFFYNKKYFNSKLKVPTIRVGVVFKHEKDALGFWRKSDRTLYIDSQMFNTEFNSVEDTIIHEMCHQAVTEISKIDEIKNVDEYNESYGIHMLHPGHGTEWVKWMKHCNLPTASYYADHHWNNYEHSKATIDYKKLIYEAKTRGLKQVNSIKVYTPVLYPSYKEGEYKIGVIADPSDKYDIKILTDTKMDFITLEKSELWEPTDFQLKEFNKDLPRWKKAVDKFNKEEIEGGMASFFFIESETNKVFYL